MKILDKNLAKKCKNECQMIRSNTKEHNFILDDMKRFWKESKIKNLIRTELSKSVKKKDDISIWIEPIDSLRNFKRD
jgi:predicted double-glycine peptidase